MCYALRRCFLCRLGFLVSRSLLFYSFTYCWIGTLWDMQQPQGKLGQASYPARDVARTSQI